MTENVAAMHSFHGAKRSGRWTDEGLAAMRHVTDDAADGVIADYFAEKGGLEASELLLDILEFRVARPEKELVSVPQSLIDELECREPVPPLPEIDFGPAQQLFRDFGPEIMTMLGSYSLPMAYSAANGAHVLAETGYLEHRVMRRLVETAQLVIDVLKPGGLEPGGDGIRSAREVRLLHAAIRHLINQTGRWDGAKLGQPINQQDMAGTLMVFSGVIIDGFDKIGIEISDETTESFVAAWGYIGVVMGVHPTLIPNNNDEARELTWMIYDMQMAGSEVGRELTAALLATMREQMPFAVAKRLPPSVVRIFMLKEAANELAVPRRPVLDFSVKMAARLAAGLDNWLHALPIGRAIKRWFSRRLVRMLVLAGRGHKKRARFEIPDELQAEWRLGKLPDAMP